MAIGRLSTNLIARRRFGRCGREPARNSCPPSMRSSSSRRSASSRRSIDRLRWVALDLLDTEMRLGDARDLRQVGDRHHLHPRREPRQRLGHLVRRPTADTCVDLVEDERLRTRCASRLTRHGRVARCACRDRRQRQGDARELTTRRCVGDGRERQAPVEPTRNDASSRPDGPPTCPAPRYGTPPPHPEPAAHRDGRGERAAAALRTRCSAAATSSYRVSAAATARRAASTGSSRRQRLELRTASSGVPAAPPSLSHWNRRRAAAIRRAGPRPPPPAPDPTPATQETVQVAADVLSAASGRATPHRLRRAPAPAPRAVRSPAPRSGQRRGPFAFLGGERLCRRATAPSPSSVTW